MFFRFETLLISELLTTAVVYWFVCIYIYIYANCVTECYITRPFIIVNYLQHKQSGIHSCC